MKPNRRLLAHALALAVPLCTWAQAEVEPNNNIAQATPLWNNSSIGGSTGTCAPTDNSTDYFSYSSPMQGVLEIITNMSNSGTTDLAVTVQLLNNSGSLLQSYTVTAGGNNTAVLDTLTYPNAGVGLYHIVVINPSTTVCTSYIITCDMGAPLFANDAEPNQNIAQASDTLAAGVDHDGQVSFYYGDQWDYFRILLPDDGLFSVTVSAEHASNVTTDSLSLYLHNSSGTTLQTWRVPIGASGIPTTTTITRTCMGKGAVYFLDFYSPDAFGVSYRFNYSVTPPMFADDTEPNQNTAQALDTLQPGVNLQGRLNFEYGDNGDYHRILAPDQGVLNVTISAEHAGSSTTDSLSLYLMNSSGSTILIWKVGIGANGAPNTQTFTHTCIGDGAVYFLAPYYATTCGVSYQLSYTVTPALYANDAEPNQNTAQAFVTHSDTAYDGRISFDYDNNLDYYRVQAPNDGVLSVNVSAESAGAAGTMTVYLLNSSGGALETWTANVGGSGVAEDTTFIHHCTGTENVYYLEFYSPSVCGVSYRFSYSVAAPVYADDAEPNQNLAQAFVTHSDTAYDGRVSFYYDNTFDFYRVQAPNDGVFSVNVSAENAGAAGTMTVYLLNSSGSALETWTANVGGSGVAEDTTFIHHCTGTEQVYYLEFYYPSVCGVSYRFSYSVAAPVYADDAEPNQNLAQAFVTHSDTAYDGRVSFYYDNPYDYYRVQAPDDGVFSVNVSAENAGAAGTMTVYLLNSSGSALETWTANVGGSGVAEDTTFIHHCTGTENVYYLEFYNPSVCGVSYRFSYSVAEPLYADDAEPNQNLAQAPLINLNDSVVEGRVGFGYDNNDDYFKVNHPGGVLRAITSAENAGAAGTMSVYLRNSGGSAIFTNSAVAVGGAGVPALDTTETSGSVPAGTYYIEVYSSSICGVSYRLYCNDDDNDGVCNGSDLCANTPNGEGVNTDGCSCSQVTVDDGDPCTLDECLNGDVTHTFQDADGDLTCDANDGCPNDPNKISAGACGCGNPDVATTWYADTDGDGLGDPNNSQAGFTCIQPPGYVADNTDGCPSVTGTVGSACDDGNPNTTGDALDANCNCVGSPVNCDDGDPCTVDTWDGNQCVHTFQDTDGDGTCDANDGCVNDPDKTAPGACGCGVADVATTWYADTDGDGLGDPNNSVAGYTCIQPPGYVADNTDGCPSVTGTVGSACDDGNPNTSGDALDASCNCVGTPVNCDDGDPCTVDTWDGNQCVHTFQDTDGDGTCDANDGCVNDPDKTAPGACGCGVADVATTWYADTDGDGLGDPNNSQAGYTCIQPPGYVADNTDLCPGISGTVGSACDDGNPNTTGDAIDASCTCVGTPNGGPCTGNQVVVNITTDANPAQLSWEIRDGGNVLVASGTPATPNGLNSETACLGSAVESACYSFNLLDSFGDGLAGAGGWELRTTDGKLILRDDFANGSVSPATPTASPSYGSGHSFCLPLGPANIAATECGIFNNGLGNKVYCNKVTGATQYQFEFSDPDAGFIRRIAVNHNYVIFSQMVANPLIPGVEYFARVRSNVSGPVASAHWGSGCEMGLGVPQVVVCSGLIPAPNYGHSCNETRAFNPPTNNSFIYATPVVGGTEYQFRIYNTGEGYDQTFTRNTYILQLKWNGSVAPPLMNGSTYNVQVNVKVNGTYTGFCPSSCTITIDNGGGQGAFASLAQAGFGEATLWPNPVRDGQVNLSIGDLKDAEQHITVEVQDIYGKQVFAQEFGNSGERFNTNLQLSGHIDSGVYMVNITVNGVKTVQRLSIIR